MATSSLSIDGSNTPDILIRERDAVQSVMVVKSVIESNEASIFDLTNLVHPVGLSFSEDFAGFDGFCWGVVIGNDIVGRSETHH